MYIYVQHPLHLIESQMNKTIINPLDAKCRMQYQYRPDAIDDIVWMTIEGALCQSVQYSGDVTCIAPHPRYHYPFDLEAGQSSPLHELPIQVWCFGNGAYHVGHCGRDPRPHHCDSNIVRHSNCSG